MRYLNLFSTVLLLLGAPTAARSQPDRDVKISVVAILASETAKRDVDPRLEDIAKEVEKKLPKMKRFRLAKMTCKSVPLNLAESFELAADQSATITVLKPADKDNRVQLKVTPPTLGEITYTTTCGKFFPIVTRYQSANKEWLIIAVRVQPCNGKK